MSYDTTADGAARADTSFAARYGPWALVVGASDGVGAAFARQVAERGLNVVLLARRQQVLDEVAAEIRSTYAVETRTVVVDLADAGASRSIVDATNDLDVGLLMYCAGADPNYQKFLARPVDDALSMVQRNCVAPLELCHHYAGPMVDRGRGGIILLSSGAAFVGAKNMVAYGATKAFDSIVAEALWAELHTEGVDVLGLVLGLTDTPALRRLLVERGQLTDVDDPTPVPDAASADEVAAIAIAELPNGPTAYGADNVRMGAEFFGAMTRREAVTTMMQLGGEAMGADPEPQATP